MEREIQEYRKRRRAEVKKQIQKRLDKITESKVPVLLELLAKSNPDDVCTYYLRGKIMEIQRLKEEITAFSNYEKHFTKQYRTYEGHCSKLQTDLDKIDVFGRDDLKKSRKDAFVELDEMIRVLASKAHPSGKTCEKCEVQN